MIGKEESSDGKKKTIYKIMEEVVTEMCDKYCKYPESVKEEDELYEICEKCPLNKLI